MNRTYEVMFIVRPDIEEAELDKLIEGFTTTVTTNGGEVKTTEKMGRRRLAYIVRKFQDGHYVLLNVAADGKLIAELERRLRVTEQVIKFITVRTDEEDKRLAKVKAIRDTKVKRSSLPSAALVAPVAETPAAEVAEVHTAPAAEIAEAPVTEVSEAPAAEHAAEPATV